MNTGNKIALLVGGGALVFGSYGCGKNTVGIPYGKAMDILGLQIKEFYSLTEDQTKNFSTFIKIPDQNGDGTADFIRISGLSKKEAENVKGSLQKFNKVVLHKGDGLISDPMSKGVRYPVGASYGQNGELIFDVASGKYLSGYGSANFEMRDVLMPKLRDGSISPGKVTRPVTRKDQWKYLQQKHGQDARSKLKIQKGK